MKIETCKCKTLVCTWESRNIEERGLGFRVGLLQEINIVLAKPEGLLPNFIQTHRGVEPEKMKNLFYYYSSISLNAKYYLYNIAKGRAKWDRRGQAREEESTPA